MWGPSEKCQCGLSDKVAKIYSQASILMAETNSHLTQWKYVSFFFKDLCQLTTTSTADSNKQQDLLAHVTDGGLPQGPMQMHVILVNLLRGRQAKPWVLSKIEDVLLLQSVQTRLDDSRFKMTDYQVQGTELKRGPGESGQSEVLVVCVVHIDIWNCVITTNNLMMTTRF